MSPLGHELFPLLTRLTPPGLPGAAGRPGAVLPREDGIENIGHGRCGDARGEGAEGGEAQVIPRDRHSLRSLGHPVYQTRAGNRKRRKRNRNQAVDG